MIDGRYRLVRLIGEGGMGRVYAAEHTGIGKKVALKILHAVFANTTDAVERFRAEARMTTKVANAHIVDVTDSGTTADGRLYFVMEHLDGIELGEAMRDGKLSLERSLRIARQIADALAAAHAQGVIHRDLKPENILLIERDGERDFVKVLDFGIALTVGGEQPKRRLTQPGLAVGTPEYMAPEQALENKADARSDIYALGAMLYEMATGKPAYEGDTYTKILVDKVNQDPRPPRDLRGDLPSEIEAVIVKAMARKAVDRFQSMTELSAAITDCLDVLEELSAPIIVSGITQLPEAPEPQPPPPPRSQLPTTRMGPVEKPITAQSLLLDEVDPTAATVAMSIEEPKRRTKRTKRRDLVPLTLVLGLVMGGAVALYMLVLRPSKNETSAAAPTPSVATPKPKPDTAKKTATASTAKPTPKSDAPKTAPKSETAPAPPKAAPAPKNMKQARALLAKAKTAQKKKQWDTARELFDRIARGRFIPEAGYLGLAQIALATNNPKDAAKHAKASIRLGGGAPARKVLAQANAKLKKKSR